MERLYNNIQLPDVWPPKNKETTLDQPLEVPYLSQKPDRTEQRVLHLRLSLQRRCLL